MEWKTVTVLVFVQVLVSGAASLSQTECYSLQHNNLNAAAACARLDVSLNPLCSQNPAVCTGSQDGAAVIDSRKKCEKGVTGPQSHHVSSLVMVASRRCGVNFFDIHALWNKNDSDSDYKLILKEKEEGYWESTVACIYDGTRNIASFDGHSVGQYLTQVQVVTQHIDLSADLNTADVLIETSLSRVPDHTLYAVYNDSDGKSCVNVYCARLWDKLRYLDQEQHYTPLTVDEYLAAAAWESDDELVQVNISWCSQLESDEFIVAVGSDSCTMKNRSLPCFLVRNSSSVSIGPFHWSRDSDIPVRVYSVTTRYCPNAEAREELVHLFQGCDDTSCCLGGITVPTPESATMATASGSGILTMSSQTSPCFLGGMKVPGSSDDPDSISTSSVSHSDVTNTSSATPISVMQIKEWILIIVASVLCIVFVLVLLFLLIALAAKCGLFNCASTSKLSKQLSISHHLKDSSVHPPALEVIVHSSSSQESGKLLGSSGQESHVSTPTSVESTTPLFKDHSGSSQDSHRKDPVVHVLVVYSPSTPEKDQELIRHQFIPELQSYGFKVQSHDFACIKESPSQWLEYEIAMATAVLCICNKEFKNDWENREGGTHSLPLVPSLKHLVHAAVQQNECLSKYAIILIDPADKSYIPTKYLQADPRQFSVGNVEDIVRFVRGIPSHSMSLPSSE